MKRVDRLNERRRGVVLTRKQQLADLQSTRFREIATMVSDRIEPVLKQMVEEAVKTQVQRALEEAGVIK